MVPVLAEKSRRNNVNSVLLTYPPQPSCLAVLCLASQTFSPGPAPPACIGPGTWVTFERVCVRVCIYIYICVCVHVLQELKVVLPPDKGVFLVDQREPLLD